MSLENIVLAFSHFFGILINTFFRGSPAAVPVSRERVTTMSQHRSLKGSSKITAKRNVLKRFERINLLMERGQWKPGDRGQGLRKTKPAE